MALTKCRECGGQVSTTAKACPSCGAEMPRRTSMMTWILAAPIALFVFSCTFGLGGGGRKPEPPRTPEQLAQDKAQSAISDAKWQCRQYIEPRLKAPSTAKFQNYNEFSWHNGNVSGYVDAQNSFGAQIRTTFTCHMSPDGKKWTVGAASID